MLVRLAVLRDGSPMPAALGPLANGTDEPGLRLAVKGNVYLEAHEIPSIINDYIKQVLEKRPADPLEFLVSFAEEARARRNPSAGGYPVGAQGGSEAPRTTDGEKDSTKNVPRGKKGELGAASTPERNKKIEQALLAVAVGAKGAIGPAVVNSETVERRTKSFDDALEGLENMRGQSVEFFKSKLEMLHQPSEEAMKKAKAGIDDARQRFAALVPELAHRIAPELKRTEEAYRLALEEVERTEATQLAELEAFAESLNEGPFVPGDSVEVQVIVAGKFDQDGHFIEDASLRPMLLRAQLMIGDGLPAVGRRGSKSGKQNMSKTAPAKMLAAAVNDSGMVRVKLFFEQDDVAEEYKAGFDDRWIEVPRRRVYGGQPGIKQPLPEGVEPTNVQALFAVYDLAEATLPKLQEAVGTAVADAEQELRASSVEPHIKVKHAPLKAYERAAAKAAEKYKMNFSKLLDIARLTVVCDSLAEVMAVLYKLRASTDVRIVRMKNRVHPLFPADESAGYRDVLMNVIVAATGCVCEVQVTLAAFVNIKNTGGHGCYKIGRVIGIDRVDETTHQGTLSIDVMNRVQAGLTQRLRLEGTMIPAKMRAILVSPNCLAAPHVRLMELRMGACKGLSGFDVEDMFSSKVCEALGNTIRIIDLTGTGIQGHLERVPLASFCHRLDMLLLGDNKLVGGIPKALGKLHQLRVLKLFDNKDLKGKLPPQFGQLESLEELELYRCGISGHIPKEFGTMRKLQVLTLSDNELSGPIPEEMGNLVALRLLYLHTNRLTSAIPDALGNLRCLRELLIDHNRFEGDIPLRLADAPMLKNVELPAGLRNQKLFKARFQSNHPQSSISFNDGTGGGQSAGEDDEDEGEAEEEGGDEDDDDEDEAEEEDEEDDEGEEAE